MFDPRSKPPEEGWRRRVYEVIFETGTPAGYAFDLALLGAICVSVLVVALETVPRIEARFGHLFLTVEWVLTILFSAEYILRLVCVVEPRRYALSFFGIVDLLAILPSFIGLALGEAASLQVVRALRLLRAFRLLKLGSLLREGRNLASALSASRARITVFLGAVLVLVIIQGTILYVVEGETNPGFSSIPKSMYWAIVTLTTVGYGDIAPQTPLGQAIAASVMLMGYGIIAVPTGMVSVELSRRNTQELALSTRPPVLLCSSCNTPETDPQARFCRRCASPLGRGGDPDPKIGS